jgi:hypothetical protein
VGSKLLAKSKTKTAISTNIYRTPIGGDDDAVSIGVLNLTMFEAYAVQKLANDLQNSRGATQSFVVNVQVNVPLTRTPNPNPDWKPEQFANGAVPPGWIKEFDVASNRALYRDATGSVYVVNPGTGVLELLSSRSQPNVYRCKNGHQLDYPNQLCNTCGARMPLRECDDGGVFGDEGLIARREAMQAKLDEERVERERKKTVDPSGRFSGLEID